MTLICQKASDTHLTIHLMPKRHRHQNKVFIRTPVNNSKQLPLVHCMVQLTALRLCVRPNQLGIVVTFFVNLIAQLKMASLMSLTHSQRHTK